jgi:N-acetylmuramoyl-L-alanine amidase
MELTKLLRARAAVDVFAIGFALLSLIVGISAMGAGSAEADSAAVESASQPTTTLVDAAVEAGADFSSGIALIPEGGADLWSGPDQDPYFTIHEGMALGFANRQDDWLFVTTNCNETAWVRADDVELIPPGDQQATGNDFDVSEAVIVLDPGHGDRDWGGVGPSGLSEKSVNLDIADRVSVLMESGHNVDWASGAITAGSSVPAFRSVILTRDVDGPNDGDFEANLTYRASLATAVAADAFISIHNNTVPRIDTEIPGSEVFYSVAAEGSDRLAGIIYEELLLSFGQFDADWQGGELLGARARLNPETEEDYYGLLRRATVPAVIVEGVYISEPEEEALLATEEFRQAYAEAVYRGVVRFLTTDDPGAEPNQPEYFYDDAGTVSGSVCEVPAQP